MKNNQLTFDEAQTLVCYILMTTKWREGEAEAWGELAKEMNADGNPTFPKAQSNADYFTELSDKLEAIKEKLDTIYGGGTYYEIWNQAHLS